MSEPAGRAEHTRASDSPDAGRSTLRDLRHVIRSRRYRQLLGTRLAGQLGDGAFQAGLASLVLFDPQQQPTALLVAAALSAAVLPFTLVGPFAGVFLDRWSRRDTLVGANLVRVGLVTCCAVVVAADLPLAILYVLVLASLSVNRFVLAGLGASLPHTVAAQRLVTANAMTPTLGTGAFAAGLVAGGAARAALGAGADTDAGILLAGAGLYLVAAGAASRMPGPALGPDERSEAGTLAAARAVVAGLREGAGHVWRRPVARDAIAVIGAHRFAFGLSTIATVLLARGYLAPDSVDEEAATEAAVGVLLLVGGAAALGAVTAAVVTPLASAALRGWAARRGTAAIDTWIVVALGIAALVEALFVLGLTTAALLAGAFAIGLAGQMVKIGVDTQVQTGVEDAYRGRAFAFYDVVYNAATVVAALLAVAVVPDDGYSRVLYGGIAVGYAAAALGYGRAVRRRRTRPVG